VPTADKDDLMSLKLKFSSAFAGLAFVFTIVAADGSGAAAQNRTPQRIEQITPQAVAAESAPANLLPGSYPAPTAAELRAPVEARLPTPVQSAADAPAAPVAGVVHPSLAGALAGNGADLTRELECLAGAIYFEAKSESLEGQLAVGRVVINRAKSGRFPASYCGVVYQRSQFSFIRGGAMPPINRASRDWREAVAMARIADANAYPSVAEGALFFHATRVSPNWRLTRVARVDNHVFYR
jgi:spore germination cell wall hydrolase CwlJ-like protein